MAGTRFPGRQTSLKEGKHSHNHRPKLYERLVKFPAGQEQAEIKIQSHITDIELQAFNPNGSRAQALSGAFVQGFDFGITAQGASDLLAAVFKGAPNSDDLVRRPARFTRHACS